MSDSLVDPLVCPLCGNSNLCINLGAEDVARTCWCNDPALTFPEALLAQIPPEKRRQACVCRDCVLAYHRAHGSGKVGE